MPKPRNGQSGNGNAGGEEMVKDLKAKVFATRELKFLTLGAQGKVVRTL
jgi:hypothetical protein